MKEGKMKRYLYAVPLVILLCFTLACRDKVGKADLEKPTAQAKVEEKTVKTIRMEEMS